MQLAVMRMMMLERRRLRLPLKPAALGFPSRHGSLIVRSTGAA